MYVSPLLFLSFCSCVGKLSNGRKNNVTWNASGTNASRVVYPRSKAVQAHLSRGAFYALAVAGDYSVREKPETNESPLIPLQPSLTTLHPPLIPL